MPKTWFIAGASRGMGRELAEQLLARGDHVAATVRDTDHVADLADRYGDALWVRALDVTDPAAVRAVTDEVFASHARIDVVVANAGYGVFGVAEDLTDEQIDSMIATNLTGSIQLASAAVPHLRAQGGGQLMQMSSMGAHIAFPAFSLYHVTKWGIEGFYEALAQEVEPFGIRTTLVEPGVVRTGSSTRRRGCRSASRTAAVRPITPAPTVEDMVDSQEKTVAAMIRAGDSAEPPRRLVLGSDAWRLVTDALRGRLDELTAQRDNAATADIGFTTVALGRVSGNVCRGWFLRFDGPSTAPLVVIGARHRDRRDHRHAADVDARRHHRHRRAAAHAGRSRSLRRGQELGHHRLRAGLRRAAAARRPGR